MSEIRFGAPWTDGRTVKVAVRRGSRVCIFGRDFPSYDNATRAQVGLGVMLPARHGEEKQVDALYGLGFKQLTDYVNVEE
jgi:hypothetical protein